MFNTEKLKTLLLDSEIISNSRWNAAKYRHHEMNVEIKNALTSFFVERAHKEPRNISEAAYWFVNDLFSYPKHCPCGVAITYYHSFTMGYLRDYCSSSCAQKANIVQEKIKATNIAIRGVSHQMHDPKIKKKIAETNLEKYGVVNVFQNNKIKQKIKKTIQDNFGVDNVSQSFIIKQKKEKTSIKNFGVSYPIQNSVVNAKIRAAWTPELKHSTKVKSQQTLLNNYGVTNPSKIENLAKNRSRQTRQFYLGDKTLILDDPEVLKQELKEKSVVDLAKEMNVAFTTVYNAAKRIGLEVPKHERSKEERWLSSVMDDLGVYYELNNNKIIAPKQIDLVLPDKNIGFEINGSWWHSELNGKDKKYHLQKTIACEEKNWRLIHIFDDEIRDHSEIIISKIKSLLYLSKKIYARNCQVREISSKVRNQFLKVNHIQGGDRASVSLGLFYENEIIATMSFIKSRYNKSYEWELSRYASKNGITVVGGASRLLTIFKREHNPKSIITYADRRFSNGKMYEMIGFNFLYNSDPSHFYLVNNKRENRLLWQKHLLEQKLPAFNPDLSAKENMIFNGYTWVWDCGHKVYGWAA